ncbi:hypothetical protein L596_019261 [Steinernema carpocapsae]|uniref:Uncharacterized protein n=1 Tax=Steinernema carpocapsae TaxID=34508 RepID=A0A4U5MPV5_STECR|nr:hypothetical protein L596_019261 [Steinernema carpocapsae]
MIFLAVLLLQQLGFCVALCLACARKPKSPKGPGITPGQIQEPSTSTGGQGKDEKVLPTPPGAASASSEDKKDPANAPKKDETKETLKKKDDQNSKSKKDVKGLKGSGEPQVDKTQSPESLHSQKTDAKTDRSKMLQEESAKDMTCGSMIPSIKTMKANLKGAMDT